MKGRDIKDKMDFWGRAKNKGNKSADHEGMTRLVSAEGAGRKGPGDNSTPGQMTCWRIEKSTQEVSSQFTKPTRAGWLSAGPWSARGGWTKQPTAFLPLTFFPKSFPLFWQTSWQRAETDRGDGFSLHTPNRNQTKPNQSVVGSAPAASVLICWLSACLICFCLCPAHNYATA